MIFYVSTYETTGALQAAPNTRWFSNFADAKREAQILADMTKEPHYVYKFEQYDCIEPILPQKTYKLQYSKVESQYITVTAANMSEAVDKGFELMKNTEYELDKAWEVTDEEI